MHVEDGVQTKLELLAILPRDELGEILASELEKEGFSRDGQHMERTDEEGVRVRVDLETGAVTVDASEERELNLEAERSGVVWEELLEQARAAMTEEANQELVQQADIEERALREGSSIASWSAGWRVQKKTSTRPLIAPPPKGPLNAEFAQLGEIQEIHEDAESGGLTIRVKV